MNNVHAPQVRQYDRVNARFTWNQKNEAHQQFSGFGNSPRQVMRKHQEATGPQMYQTNDVHELNHWQGLKRNMARGSMHQLSDLAKNITNVNDLRNYASTIHLPCEAKLDELNPNQVYAVPVDYGKYPNTEAVIILNVKMINWLGQAVASKKRLASHADGKYKLCYDSWVLITIGTHTYTDASASHTFLPLICSIGRDGESEEHMQMVGDALDVICMRFWGQVSPFAILIADHSAGIKNGIKRRSMKFGNCYAHIMFKLRRGDLSNIRKNHPHFDDLAGQLQDLHLVHSDGMKDLMIELTGDVWRRWQEDKEDQMIKKQWALNSLWNEYMCGDWSNWTLADCFGVAFCIPNNNCQVSWLMQPTSH